MDEIGIILIRGIGSGAVIALIGMSFNVVYNSSGILNFAQGHMLILGGVFGFLFLPADASPLVWIGLLLCAALAIGAIMTLQGFLTLLPLRSSVEQHSWLISTLAVSIVISAGILITKGPLALTVATPFRPLPALGSVLTPAGYVIAAVLAIACYAALHFFHKKTLTGLAMSALAQDMEAAQAAGIRVRRLQLTAFAISGLIAGATGYGAASILTLSADSPIRYVLNGFIAVVVGGLGNNLGTLIGGLLIGIILTWAAYQFGGELQNAVALTMLVSILMLRPQGIFGRPQARRV